MGFFTNETFKISKITHAISKHTNIKDDDILVTTPQRYSYEPMLHQSFLSQHPNGIIIILNSKCPTL